MRVLLTNNTLDKRAGTELYIYDVATELQSRGHEPIAFSTVLGDVAQLLRAATVPVIDDLSRLATPPDIIHGHHHFDSLIAVLTFPNVPAINFCHGWLPWEEEPLRFPSVTDYVAVDAVCRDRLIFEHGIPPERVHLILNFVDTRRFRRRAPLPPEPKRALAFGNLFENDASLGALREACGQAGIELDVAGLTFGNPLTQPESTLGRYDLVFAKARAALEAMAVGTAVILCGPRGLGPMVTPAEFDRLRVLNFGIRTFTQVIDVPNVLAQIRRYDPSASASIVERVGREAALPGAVDQLVSLYESAVKRFPRDRQDPSAAQDAAAQYLRSHAAVLKGRVDHVAHLETKARDFDGARVQLNQALAREKAVVSLFENMRTEAENTRVQLATAQYRETKARAQAEIALAHANHDLANVRSELEELRNSATWRISRFVCSAKLLRFLRPVLTWIGSRARRKTPRN